VLVFDLQAHADAHLAHLFHQEIVADLRKFRRQEFVQLIGGHHRACCGHVLSSPLFAA
jgi:hypothetical protein